MNSSTVLIDRISKWQRMAGIAGVVGLIATAIGFVVGREQFFHSWLFAGIFWAGVSSGFLGLYLLHNVVGGNWGATIRRPLEAGARTVWIGGILLAPILAGLAYNYPWAKPDAAKDPSIAFKASYLNAPFFTARFVLYFLLWAFFAYRLTALSNKTDSSSDPGIQIRMRQFAAPSLLAFVLLATFGFFDWVMSLEPHWYSTIYGAMFLIGHVLTALSITIVLTVKMSDESPFKENLNMGLWHDLGNLMLAFTMLWAYLSFSQLIIIWSGNLPEEIVWYIKRFDHGWGWVAWAVSIFHFCVPFFILLHRFVKRTPKLLVRVCQYMIVMRILDVFWISQPPLRPSLSVSWMDVTAFAGVGGAWLFFFFRELKSRPLVPIEDGRLLANRQSHQHA